MIRGVKDVETVEEILKEVEELVDYTMDVVVDKAEKYKDPAIPH